MFLKKKESYMLIETRECYKYCYIDFKIPNKHPK